MDALIKEHTCFSKWHRIILSFEQGISKPGTNNAQFTGVSKE